MTLRITKLRVTDFRSIRGTVDLDLDAPVVLIHGPNGSGKTSLLAAIEMGLTGAVASLSRFDASYVENLVHYDADEASVYIASRHPNISRASTELTVHKSKIHGDPLLSPKLRRFYIERSFLAQATLGRLLEIYENSDTRDAQSPLTRFVKDLLGLDVLDELISGLHPAGDKRRLRRSLPLYADAEAHAQGLQQSIGRLDRAVQEARESFTNAEVALAKALEPFSFGAMGLEDLIKVLSGSMEDQKAQIELGELRREINAAISLLAKVETSDAEETCVEAEKALHDARDNENTWKKGDGTKVDIALEFASRLVANLPSPTRSGRFTACMAAINEITAEAERVAARLEMDGVARKGRDKSQSDLEKANARALRLDKRLENLSEQSGDLARVLSELTPFIVDDVCPVCRRDYSEASDVSLHSHVSEHIARLSRAAGQLQELSVERRNVRSTIAEAERTLAQHNANVLEDADRIALLTLSSDLNGALQRLTSAIPLAKRGDEVTAATEGASRRLSSLRQSQESLAGIRASAINYTVQLGANEAQEEESTREILSRCLIVVTERLEAMRVREAQRQTALSEARVLKDVTKRKLDVENQLQLLKGMASRAESALDSANEVRGFTKELSHRAIAVRTNIVRRVFNESLNEIWKDLFIRLAPEEPFIPAFAVPASVGGPVEARLETRYRGQTGGNPKAILSAGNLNTAALTLFLSLHLAVEPRLPWLVIDDPVQSMDEIHISQFAALLRRLAKQHDRQILIAVHEKPLFDYLALELSPASEGDRLITVELSRGSNGATIYYPNAQTWDPRRVFQVAG